MKIMRQLMWLATQCNTREEYEQYCKKLFKDLYRRKHEPMGKD